MSFEPPAATCRVAIQPGFLKLVVSQTSRSSFLISYPTEPF